MRRAGLGPGTQKKRHAFLVPLHSVMAAARLSALERGGDLDAAQALPTAAQDSLDAVVAGAQPARQLQVWHCEVARGQ